MIRVLVADDNPVVRHGVAALLAASAVDIDVVGEAGNGREALRLEREQRPDVVLLDVRMPVMGGVEAARALAGRCKVLMLTYSDDEENVVAAIRAGAHGYLVHGRFDTDELAAAVRALVAGQRVLSPAVAPAIFAALRDGSSAPSRGAGGEGPDALTPREREIMGRVAAGRANRAIAGELVLSEKTVKNHIRHIYEKLGAASRAEATALWLGVTGAEGPGPAQGPR
ncbi:MAG: response regulator transcription factor [Solirubrobacteraceae bacterium MAG38_C4-C5]|nr:response regulator transcription factor [Candidatus Siliceabacter maunaloa]